MKDKMVHQYKCDFCVKKKYSKFHMKNHEKYCTMNPDRKCRMCDLIEEEQQPMGNLLSIFPQDLLKYYYKIRGKNEFIGLGESDKLTDMFEPYLDELYKKVHNCPACIFAVIRQSGIYGLEIGFDYKKEIEDFWKKYNENLD